MDQEKLYKCNDCDAKLSTLECLKVHQRRHEMSLNLSVKPTCSSSLLTPSILSKGSLSAGIIGFLDETPTPTRFIKNCEEVGLFQDLQNVNPFDEDFKKAANSATATPSSTDGNAFDFSFSAALGSSGLFPGTPKSSSWRSKRRYSEQDSLNTPQVFPYHSGYVFPTPPAATAVSSNSSSLITNPHGSIISQENLRSILQIEPSTPTTPPTTTYNHLEHASIIAYTSAISQQTNKHDHSAGSKVESPLVTPPVIASTTGSVTPGGSTGSVIRSPSIKELNNAGEDPNKKRHSGVSTFSSSLSPSIITTTSSTNDLIQKGSRLSLLKNRSKPNLKLDLRTVSTSKSDSLDKLKSPEAIRNTPCKQRSTRHVLERKRAASQRSRERRNQWIDGLESKCRALEALLAESQSEVAKLKSENEKLRNQLLNTESTANTDAVQKPTTSNEEVKTLEQSCQTEMAEFNITESAKAPVIACSISGEMMTTLISSIVLPTVKAKRGRPKKGEERRIPIISVPIASSTSASISKTLPKIPILPLPRKPVTKRV